MKHRSKKRKSRSMLLVIAIAFTAVLTSDADSMDDFIQDLRKRVDCARFKWEAQIALLAEDIFDPMIMKAVHDMAYTPIYSITNAYAVKNYLYLNLPYMEPGFNSSNTMLSLLEKNSSQPVIPGLDVLIAPNFSAPNFMSLYPNESYIFNSNSSEYENGSFPYMVGGPFPPMVGGPVPPIEGGPFPPMVGGPVPPIEGAPIPSRDGGLSSPPAGIPFSVGAPTFDGESSHQVAPAIAGPWIPSINGEPDFLSGFHGTEGAPTLDPRLMIVKIHNTFTSDKRFIISWIRPPQNLDYEYHLLLETGPCTKKLSSCRFAIYNHTLRRTYLDPRIIMNSCEYPEFSETYETLNPFLLTYYWRDKNGKVHWDGSDLHVHDVLKGRVWNHSKYLEPYPRQLGNAVNGIYDGVIGNVQVGETTVAYNRIYISEYISRFAQYTASVRQDPYCIVLRKSQQFPYGKILLLPYAREVWLVLVATLVFAALVWAMAGSGHRVSSSKENGKFGMYTIPFATSSVGSDYSLPSSAVSLTNDLQQLQTHSFPISHKDSPYECGSYPKTHEQTIGLDAKPFNWMPNVGAIGSALVDAIELALTGSSSRPLRSRMHCLILGVLLLPLMVLTHAYQGQLLGFLAHPPRIYDPQTMEEAEPMITRLYASGVTSTAFYDSEASDTMKALGRKLDIKVGLHESISALKSIAENGEDGYLMLADTFDYISRLKELIKDGDSPFHRVPENVFSSGHSAFITDKYNTRFPVFNMFILRIVEGGLYDFWVNSQKYLMNINGITVPTGTDTSKPQPLTLNQLAGPFASLMLGWVVSITVFGISLMRHSWNTRFCRKSALC